MPEVNDRRARWHDNGRGPRVVIDIGSESVVTTADRARELRDDLTAVLEEIYAAAGPKRDGDHLAALEVVAESAAADVALYQTKGGGPTWDDERVGRMLARDPVVAAQLPVAIAEISRHRAMVERLEAWADQLVKDTHASGGIGLGPFLAAELRNRMRGDGNG